MRLVASDYAREKEMEFTYNPKSEDFNEFKGILTFNTPQVNSYTAFCSKDKPDMNNVKTDS